MTGLDHALEYAVKWVFVWLPIAALSLAKLIA